MAGGRGKRRFSREDERHAAVTTTKTDGAREERRRRLRKQSYYYIITKGGVTVSTFDGNAYTNATTTRPGVAGNGNFSTGRRSWDYAKCVHAPRINRSMNVCVCVYKYTTLEGERAKSNFLLCREIRTTTRVVKTRVVLFRTAEVKYEHTCFSRDRPRPSSRAAQDKTTAEQCTRRRTRNRRASVCMCNARV